MRRLIALMAACALLVLPCGGFADEDEEPSLAQRWQAWLRQTGDLADALAGEIAPYLEQAGAALGEKLDAAQTYIEENLSSLSEEIRQAWETLVAAANDKTRSLTQQAGEAYAILRAWADEHAPILQEELRSLIDALGCAADVPEARISTVDAYVAANGHEDVRAAWETVQARLAGAEAVSRGDMDAAMAKLRMWLAASSDSEAGAVLLQLDMVLRDEYLQCLDAYIDENGGADILGAWQSVKDALDGGADFPAEDADALRAWFQYSQDEPSAAAWGMFEAILAH